MSELLYILSTTGATLLFLGFFIFLELLPPANLFYGSSFLIFSSSAFAWLAGIWENQYGIVFDAIHIDCVARRSA